MLDRPLAALAAFSLLACDGVRPDSTQAPGAELCHDWPRYTRFKWTTCPGHWLLRLDISAAGTTSDLCRDPGSTLLPLWVSGPSLPVGRAE